MGLLNYFLFVLLLLTPPFFCSSSIATRRQIVTTNMATISTRIKYWLLKSEPQVYGISKLQTEKTGRWDGVRNYQARNFLNTMKIGDCAFFYHSSCAQPGIYGRARVSSLAYNDPTAADKASIYYDAKNTDAWKAIDVTFEKKYTVPLLLPAIKELPLGEECPLVKKGNRLSVIPLTDDQYTLLNSALMDLNCGEGPEAPVAATTQTVVTSTETKRGKTGSSNKLNKVVNTMGSGGVETQPAAATAAAAAAARSKDVFIIINRKATSTRKKGSDAVENLSSSSSSKRQRTK